MAGKKHKFDPAKHCGAGRKRDGLRCTQPKGFRTAHPGEGRCKYHGGHSKKGDKRIKHGLYSDVAGTRLREWIRRVRESGVASTDLTPEVELLRAMTLGMVSDADGFRDAVIAWHKTTQPLFRILLAESDPQKLVAALTAFRAANNDRPRDVIDPDRVAVLADRIGRMVERLHNIKKTSAVTWESVQILIERMGLVLTKHLTDHEIIGRIVKDWAAIDVPIVTHASSSD